MGPATTHVVSGPDLDPLPRDAHLLRPVMDWAAREPDRPMTAYRDGDRFVDVTAAELYRRCRALAKGLIASGLRPGGRVALMSHTRLEWVLVDYAVLAAGGATVPVYETSSAEQVQWIVDDSGASLLVVETPAMADLYARVAGRPTACEEVFVIESGGLDQLAGRGESVPDAVLDRRIESITVDDLATIVYTSGTTGRPKGCPITHGNLRTNVRQTLEAIRPMLQPDEVGLQFLPLAHTLAKIITLVGVEWGVKGALCSNLASLTEEMAMVRPTMIVSVPRIFEKVFNAAEQKAAGDGHQAVFDKAAEVAVKWSRARARGGCHHPVTEAEHAVFEHLVYRKVHEVFGGRLRFAFSGGGPLGERLTHFFNGVGVKIFEGYGLTETSPVLTVNTAHAWEPGTVGRPVAGTSIGLAEDGEILAKGPQVFAGYWNDEAATRETFDDEGWFRTGDIGAIDDGYLRITGRKKELIVTAAGKNVAPAPLEDRIRAHPLVSQAVVVGDNRPFVAAMITIDEEFFAQWAPARGLAGASVAGAREHPALRTAVQDAIDEANGSVSRAESIRKFAILPRDLAVNEGELTPTLKVRRSVVEKTFASVVEELYRS